MGPHRDRSVREPPALRRRPRAAAAPGRLGRVLPLGGRRGGQALQHLAAGHRRPRHTTASPTGRPADPSRRSRWSSRCATRPRWPPPSESSSPPVTTSCTLRRRSPGARRSRASCADGGSRTLCAPWLHELRLRPSPTTARGRARPRARSRSWTGSPWETRTCSTSSASRGAQAGSVRSSCHGVAHTRRTPSGAVRASANTSARCSGSTRASPDAAPVVERQQPAGQDVARLDRPQLGARHVAAPEELWSVGVRAVARDEEVDVAHWSGFRTTTAPGAARPGAPRRPGRSAAARAGRAGSTRLAPPANDATCGSQSAPSSQAGWGWRHSHRPGATSRTSTSAIGLRPGPAGPRTRHGRTEEHGTRTASTTSDGESTTSTERHAAPRDDVGARAARTAGRLDRHGHVGDGLGHGRERIRRRP